MPKDLSITLKRKARAGDNTGGKAAPETAVSGGPWEARFYYARPTFSREQSTGGTETAQRAVLSFDASLSVPVKAGMIAIDEGASPPFRANILRVRDTYSTTVQCDIQVEKS